MQSNSFDVIRIPTHGPGDVSGLMALIVTTGLLARPTLSSTGPKPGSAMPVARD